MSSSPAAQRIMQEIHDEFLSRQHYVNPKTLVIANLPSLRGASTKFAVVVLPHTQFTADGPKLRIGARWLLRVPNVKAWPLSERKLMIGWVIDDVIEYIEKGKIDHAKVFDVDADAMRVQLERSTDRTIQ